MRSDHLSKHVKRHAVNRAKGRDPLALKAKASAAAAALVGGGRRSALNSASSTPTTPGTPLTPGWEALTNGVSLIQMPLPQHLPVNVSSVPFKIEPTSPTSEEPMDTTSAIVPTMMTFKTEPFVINMESPVVPVEQAAPLTTIVQNATDSPQQEIVPKLETEVLPLATVMTNGEPDNTATTIVLTTPAPHPHPTLQL